jgi:phage shock protein E
MNILQKLFGAAPVQNLQEAIAQGALLVDVRSPGEFAQGHVKGSVNIPVETVANNIQQFKNHPAIIVFCRSGNRSSMAKSILEQHGFTNVINAGTWNTVAGYVK